METQEQQEPKDKTPQKWQRAGHTVLFPDYVHARLGAGTLFQELEAGRGKLLKSIPNDLRSEKTRVKVKLRTKNGRELGFEVIGFRPLGYKEPEVMAEVSKMSKKNKGQK